jgi:tryptophan synthase beta chain
MTAGRFGRFGGRYVPEALIPALEQLDEVRSKAMVDPEFLGELDRLHRTYTGRPSIITEVPRFAAHAGGGAHHPQARGPQSHRFAQDQQRPRQALLTKRMGKRRIIAETGAGQHGVATATAAALMGLDCTVYMGKVDTERQALNVARMRILGAEVVPVEHGSATLKDAINEALRDWVANVHDTHYCIGTVTGPHPFPEMVRDFHRIIGVEARAQVLDLTGRLPDAVIACVGGGSNAMGIFHRFIDDAGVRLIGVEAGGEGIESGRHAARFASAEPGVFHGAMSYLMQDDDGQTLESHSVSRDWTTRASVPSTPTSRTPAAPSTATPPTRRPWRPSGCCAAPRASSRPWSPRTRSPGRSRSAELGPDALISSISPAAATRTCTPPLPGSG